MAGGRKFLNLVPGDISGPKLFLFRVSPGRKMIEEQVAKDNFL
jgi:hypothetical protein